MSSNGATVEDAEMAECDGEKVVTMMDVLQEQQEFEDDANAVLGASDDKNCTYSKGYIKRQAVYACLTCCNDAKIDPEKRAGVCLACSLTCHENHDLVELYTKRNFCCDCGNPKFNHPCQYTENKTTLNDDNIYNQNFSGLYCICHRPYPDPDGVEEEMIQCIVCEDWLHASHLEATVPSSELYAEMICRACMEKNEFLHDYGKYAVNGDVDVLNINEIVDSSIQCNGDTTKLNGVYAEPGSDKTDSVEAKDSDEMERSIKASHDNDDEEQTQTKESSVEDTVVDNPVENNQAKDVSDKAVEENPAGENQNEDVSVKADDENAAVENQNKDVSDKADDENPAGENQNKDGSEKADDENPAGETQNKDVSDKADDENCLEVNQSEDTNDKVPTPDGISDIQSCDNLPNESTDQGSLNEAPIDSTETKAESTTNIEDSAGAVDEMVTEKNEHESPSNVQQESNGEVTDNKDSKDVELENTSQEKQDSADPDITSAGDSSVQMDESLLATDNHISVRDEKIKENKRKLSTEESGDVSFKKAKLGENECLRPKKGEKRIFKGATFWPSHFRQKLCTCNECIAMYKDLSVLFLIDPEDTVTAYEDLGKKKSDGTASTQYEKGLEALSSLGRIQQINALTEYNKMRDKLLDFLKSFKDRKEVVKEEDIKAFFAGMKPKREPDGVYFCR